ncbi:hypothetical protein, partial [Hymenobacter sp. AT01-02]|uniref:hypothetical protein n=1 Tax=Hymenobacter sp. AT01-02 TaxID=1571877 RepID=UPI000A45BDF9
MAATPGNPEAPGVLSEEVRSLLPVRYQRRLQQLLAQVCGRVTGSLAHLRQLQSADPQVQQQVATIVSGAVKQVPTGATSWAGNNDEGMDDLASLFQQLAPQGKASAKQQDELVQELAKISYRQLGEALRYLEPIPFADEGRKYSFLRTDWGFFLLPDVRQPAVRAQFRKLYDSLSEEGLYHHYLRQGGIDYVTA